MGSRRRRVMNDDILYTIFKDLDLKDLFALQRVSQQFNDCVKEVLLTNKRVSIGFNDLKATSGLRYFVRNFEAQDWNRIDITPAITLKGIAVAMDYNKQNRLESIVRQFRGVKKLYLSSTVISFKTMELFVNQWPQLQGVYFYDIDIYYSKDTTDETITEWAQLLSKVKHISIGSIDRQYISIVTKFVQRMSSFNSIDVWGLKPTVSDQTITLSLLTDSLAANMRCLYIGVSSMDSQAIDVITSKCRQIIRLEIYESSKEPNAVEIDLWNQWFALICNRLKCLTHLNTRLGDISSKNFAQNIAKLKDLQKLQIISSVRYSQEMQRMCFDTQDMARYMQPMVTLRTLLLLGLKCSPNWWSNLIEMFPNVRKLTLNHMYYRTDCDDGNNCNLCFYRCMHLVSKLPKLKHIIICNVIGGHITRHILELFTRVDGLQLVEIPGEDLIEVLIYFLTKTLANKKRVFRLILLPIVKRELIQKMEEMNVSMPESVIISNGFNVQSHCQ